MKNLKSVPARKCPFLFLTCLLAVAFCTCVGCITLTKDSNGVLAVNGHQINPNTVAADLRIAARAGVREAVKVDPAATAYFELSISVLDTQLNTNGFDPVLLRAALAKIPIDKLQDPTVVNGIEDALQLYENHCRDVVDAKLEKNIYLKPMLIGLRNGIASALNLPEIPLPVWTPTPLKVGRICPSAPLVNRIAALRRY